MATLKQSDIMCVLTDSDERPRPAMTVREIASVMEDLARDGGSEYTGYVGWEREGVYQALLRMRQRGWVEQLPGEGPPPNPRPWRATEKGCLEVWN